MKLTYLNTHKVPTYVLCYLMNGEPGEMNQDEINQVDSYVNELIQTFEKPVYFDPSEEEYFTWRNDVTGYIGSTVVDCKVYTIE